MRFRLPISFLVACLCLFGAPATNAETPGKITAEQTAFFENHIRPALVKHCYSCHSADEKIRGGLLLDSRDGWQLGGDSGPAIEPGHPERSLLYEAITWADPDTEMPPKKKMPASDIANFKRWIEMGAPDPRVPETRVVKSSVDIDAGREFWAFQAPKNQAPPAVKNKDWPAGPVDQFVLAKLEQNGLQPAAPAEPVALLRRLHFDLIGLPPTQDETKTFLAALKDTPTNPQKVIAAKVDALLASPHFGERFGQHWLDVARYAESSGKDVNALFPRDYVIDAFNADKPFNRFVQEQIAGDLLPAKTDELWRDNLIATGFLAIGTKTLNDQNPRQFAADLADEQIDATFTAFMGLTVACARCHDHKSDPIPTTDYYALAGVFLSTETFFGTTESILARRHTRLLELPVPDADPMQVRSPQEIAMLQRRLDQSLAERAELMRTVGRGRGGMGGGTRDNPQMARGGNSALTPEIQRRLVQLRSIIPGLQANIDNVNAAGESKSLCMGVQDREQPVDPVVLVRGELDKPAQPVDRGYLQVLHRDDAPAFPEDASGRRQLAKQIASDDNPLTARVMANRVWLHLFGRGLVDSPNNFGATGQRPTHPALLDHLAIDFMENDWSVKQLVRSLVLSKSYQQSSTFSKAHFSKDPDNHYYWRSSPRALDAEQLRDAMLLVSGTLDPERPKGSVIAKLGDSFIGPRVTPQSLDQPAAYRSVYLPRPRDAMPEALALFDAADNNRSSGKRDQTNVPGQALYLMNNPFVVGQSKALAKRLFDASPDPRVGVPLGFEICFNRQPTRSELQNTGTLFKRFQADAKANGGDQRTANIQAYFAFCQSLLVSAEFRYLN